MSKKPELKDLPGVGSKLEDKLREAGIKTVLNMSRAKADKLAEKVEGLSESGAAKLIEAAQGLLPDGAPPKTKAAEKKPAKKAEAKPEKKAAPKKETIKKSKEAKSKKKKAPPKKKVKVEVPLRVQNTDQRILKIAKQKKKRMPRFRAEGAHRWIRVSDSWRKLRGIDSATREKRKGRIAMVSSGYRTPKAVRNLHPSMYVEVRVHRASELEELNADVHAVRIAATVGFRKRQEIIAAADAKLMRVLNPGRSEEVEEEDLFTDLDMEED
ncbi:MAG: 50S ribosomal protein L32e [Candidatus Thorarchaeota archaeon]|nr:50S ribosomal protein L32e [Candidatus Thorarchaeota archaeon]